MWIANHLFQRDPITLAGMTLARTTNMRVALMAMTPLTVHPVQLAMAAATLDEFHPGRVILCLGVGAPADLQAIEAGTAKPVRAMREAMQVCRALLAGETVRVDGEIYRARGRALAGGARTVPLMLAASGPQMLELAGAAADGVLISAGTSVPFVEACLAHVANGAKGRKVRACGVVYGSVDADATRAHDRLRRLLAILLRGGHHAPNLAMGGSRLDQEAVNAAVTAEDWPRAEGLIGNDIVRAHAASGTPDDVRARLAAYRAAGLDEIVLSGVREESQIRRLLDAARPVP